MTATQDEKLVPLRAKIDEIDAQIVKLLDQRAAVVHEVGVVKGHHGTAVFRPERENLILERVAKLSERLEGRSVKAVFREILSGCRALERTTTVSYLGPAGTFSEMAVLRRFGSSVEATPCQSIPEVFHTTENNKTDFGVVPVENSTQGTIPLTLDLLMNSQLKIAGEISVPVVHCLMSKSTDMSSVRMVMAHPQALAQCREWLAQHLPDAEQLSCSSNAEGARLAAENPEIAAIAAQRAADLYGLNVLAEGIQDWAGNRTRFLVLGQHITHKSSAPFKDKTTFVFSVPHRSGTLFAALEPLSEYGISMMHLESRPARNGAWEYNFFVDVEGHIEDEPVKKALDAIQKNAAVFKLLGSYPVAGN